MGMLTRGSPANNLLVCFQLCHHALQGVKELQAYVDIGQHRHVLLLQRNHSVKIGYVCTSWPKPTERGKNSPRYVCL